MRQTKYLLIGNVSLNNVNDFILQSKKEQSKSNQYFSFIIVMGIEVL